MDNHSKINWPLFVVVFALSFIGIMNLYSALKLWGESGLSSMVWLQILWMGIGTLFCVVVAISDYRIFERLAMPLYIISIALLIYTLFMGKTVGGNKNWIGIGGFGIQPSEFAKFAMILVLGKYFANNPRPEGFNFIDLIKPGILAGLPTFLVLLMHDVGSTLFMFLLFMSVAWFAKVKKLVIIVIALACIAGAVFGYSYVLNDFQRARIITFVDPTYDVKGSGYHMTQSRIAIGSGKIWGKGYLRGNINKLRYLPAKHTDFVFPVLAEEWGFVGSMVVLSLYFALISMIIEVAKQARDRFGIFLSVGIAAYFFWQITVNICGVIGLMPLTGVTLPFLSYGGSSTINLMILVGLLFTIYRKRFVF